MQYCTIRYNAVSLISGKDNTVEFCIALHIIVQICTVPYRTRQYCTLPCNAVQHGTVQPSTIQYNPVQFADLTYVQNTVADLDDSFVLCWSRGAALLRILQELNRTSLPPSGIRKNQKVDL